MTTATLARPQQPVLGRDEQPAPRVLGPYLGYVGYFVGAGLISGGIVHQPLDPARYTTIALAGVGVFLLATVLNELVLPPTRPTPARAARLIGASLALSLGIGMLSGGIQHFSDFPERAATLIPAGIVLSFVAYVARSAHRPLRTACGWRGAGVVVLAAAAYLVLQPLAADLAASGSAGHDHGATGSATTTTPVADGHAPDSTGATGPVPAVDDSGADAAPVAGEGAAGGAHGDGHDGHAH